VSMDSTCITFALSTYDHAGNSILALQTTFFYGLIASSLSVFAAAVVWSLKSSDLEKRIPVMLRNPLFTASAIVLMYLLSLALSGVIMEMTRLGFERWRLENLMVKLSPGLSSSFMWEHRVFRPLAHAPGLVRFLAYQITPTPAKEGLYHIYTALVAFLSCGTAGLSAALISLNVYYRVRDRSVSRAALWSAVVMVLTFLIAAYLHMQIIRIISF
jgi:hypothetical protein